MWPFRVDSLNVNKPYRIKVGKRTLVIKGRKDMMRALRIRERLLKEAGL